jgi:DNA repair protein RecO (recombination protein O)
MVVKTQGIVLKQRNIGENDRILTILSRDLGIIEASARGVKRLKSPLAGASQVLCYSEFCLYAGKSGYIVNSAESIEQFYSLRLDVVNLSLAVYFCDLTAYLFPAAEGLSTSRSWEYLRLLLNTLALLEKGKREPALLKSIFELRVMSVSGFMPDLVCCEGCGAYEKELMAFFPLESKLYCSDCLPGILSGTEEGEAPLFFQLPRPVLYAMRHIIYSDDDKVFSFRLEGNALKQLNFITENYMLIHTDGKFRSLTMYRSLADPGGNVSSGDVSSGERGEGKDQKENQQ